MQIESCKNPDPLFNVKFNEFSKQQLTVFIIPLVAAYKCITDQRERLEETLPLILGFILALIIVITLTIYHFHLKLTASQPQLPRDRTMYKNM